MTRLEAIRERDGYAGDGTLTGMTAVNADYARQAIIAWKSRTGTVSP